MIRAKRRCCSVSDVLRNCLGYRKGVYTKDGTSWNGVEMKRVWKWNRGMALMMIMCLLAGQMPVSLVESKSIHVVVIDAGHQEHADTGTEPVGPGAKTRKTKVAGGTTGVATGVPEYKLNLKVSRRLRRELEKRGYRVVMIRNRNNVNISNRQRALKANRSGGEIYIRIHADAAGTGSVSGASALTPSSKNPYVAGLYRSSKRLSERILKAYCKKTGFRNRGLSYRDDLTGTNWSKIPVTLIELGFMSNPAEDRNMQKTDVQRKMEKGIADGIDAYFAKK